MLFPVDNNIEKDLIDRVFQCEHQLEEAIYEAAKYYSSTGHHLQALNLLVRIADYTVNLEKKAFFRLAAGQVAEKDNEFTVAANEYRKGLENQTSDEETAYLLNNNLGYSLIQIGEYVEAERFCNQAITIDMTRYNAHKNLGLALQGQGKYLEAATALQRASLMSKDPRAGNHLKALLKDHPEIKDSFKRIRIVKEGYAFIQNPSKLDC